MNSLKFYTMIIVLCFATKQTNAQSFAPQFDTAYGNAHFCPGSNLLDTIAPSDTVNMWWKIVASNFPSDWIPFINIIDNTASYNNTGSTLWNGVTGGLRHTTYYPGDIDGGYFACGMYLAGTTTPGTYWLKMQLTDSNTLYSKNIWFIVTRIADTILPNAGVITGASSVCLASNITLTETVSGGTWDATNGNASIVGGVVTPVSAGIDTINYSVHNTCGITSASKVISINPLPVPFVSVFGEDISTLSTYVSYQWYLATIPIAGATSSTYTAISNGTYYVTVTDSNGCTGTSSAVNVTNVSVPSINAQGYQINIYPNPTYSILNIQSSTIINVRLTTIDGRAVIDKQKKNEIDISNLTMGIYLLSIFDNESGIKIKTVRITKSDK